MGKKLPIRDGEEVLTGIRLGLNANLLLSKEHQGITNFYGIYSGKMHAFTLS